MTRPIIWARNEDVVDLSDEPTRRLIERIFHAHWAPRIEAAGLDSEDVLQKVYLGVLNRNRGRRPFDPEVSSLSNYSWLVIRSVTSNALDSHRRAVRRGWVVGQDQDVALALPR